MAGLDQNNVRQSGRGPGLMILLHGYGCDQSMWRQVAPAFEDTHRVIQYDLTGMGHSDLSAYNFDRYSRLEAHAEDLLEIMDELGAEDAVVVGHSIAASIAVLAANQAPERFSQLVLLAPTPSFCNDPEAGYVGGFTKLVLEELITSLDNNHLGWAAQMAPVIAGQKAGEPAAEELTQSFCRTDPRITSHFGRVTFLADCREAMRRLKVPALILHCEDDAMVPDEAAEWMRRHIASATMHVLPVTGHCPHMTAPDQVIGAMRAGIGPS